MPDALRRLCAASGVVQRGVCMSSLTASMSRQSVHWQSCVVSCAPVCCWMEKLRLIPFTLSALIEREVASADLVCLTLRQRLLSSLTLLHQHSFPNRGSLLIN